MQIYKAHVLFTPDRTRFEVIENGYLAVDEGKVVGVYSSLPALLQDVPVRDFGDKLLIPAMNDMHVHAP